MPYATKADMLKRFGEAELIALTDRENAGVVADSLVADAIASAEGEINPYLQAQYALPLTDVPIVVRDFTCDVARYRLCGGEVVETEEVRTRYEDAIAFFRRVAEGKVSLGLTLANQPTPSVGMVQSVNADRVLSQGSLADYNA